MVFRGRKYYKTMTLFNFLLMSAFSLPDKEKKKFNTLAENKKKQACKHLSDVCMDIV